MRRRLAVLAVLTAAAVAVVVGCQDYNLSPVGACLIQPGSRRVKLSDVATADILFVVDDSGSMAGEQTNLAQNFGAFILALAKTNQQRVARGLDALEFHIAVTTSSIFRNYFSGGFSTNYGDPPSNCTADASCNAGNIGAACGAGRVCGAVGQCCNCILGVGTASGPYPAGDFVGAAGNPKVIHFLKTLPWASWDVVANPNTPPPAIQALVDQFRGNVLVGTCGSGQEQHMQASRLAVQKAIAGTQTAPPSEWPHPNAKLVVVIVGDEDDCSNDPASPILNSECITDPQGKRYPVREFADYLHSLGRPVGAGFIVSTQDGTCSYGDFGATCQPGICCDYACTGGGSCTSGVCGGQGAGIRHIALASELRSRGDDVVVGSICDASFSRTLENIAEIVKPPSQLDLPSVPAAGEIAVVRIARASGETRKICSQATSPGETATAGWWFVDRGDPTYAWSPVPTDRVYLNPASNDCLANPGETYSAEYLGVLPAGGCPSPSTTAPSAAGSQACADALGGGTADWWCYGQGTSGTCLCSENVR